MNSIVSLPRRGLFVAVLAGMLLWTGPARAQIISSDLLRGNAKVVKLFRPVVATPSESTVRIQCDGKDAALGAIVGADGWIITKASELTGKIVCRVKDGTHYDARIYGIQEEYDLALLKIDASDLKPVQWEDSKAAKVGRWVATVAPADDAVGIGVIGVATRGLKLGDQPPKNLITDGGYLGVSLEDADGGGAKIIQVSSKSAADKAGLKINDVVLQINTRKVVDMQAMIGMIQKLKPGVEVTIKARRGEGEMEFRAKLEKRPTALLGNPQEFMGSILSKRRGGFPKILQHDTVVKPSDCGGPLVDLDGKVVGINIARAGRTETYAIPSEAVQELLPDLMSGKLAPKDDSEDAPPKKK
jgi:serine protease Do